MTANVAVATQEKGNEPEREDMNTDRYMIKRSGVNRNGQWTEYEFTEDEFKSRLGVEERGEFDINQGHDNGKPVVYVIFGDPYS